ncbi:MAG: helix-turn-helix transcriptional regulator [Deltaproteobacteria bacterium]|nr:helix-turn-helix transcriptional regulator [Candidatus Anaeroferrophillus wilburensis]MBN2888807.1 helix-turn-helix transcriptional regulator [Deltaproteobacteria bacterium]
MHSNEFKDFRQKLDKTQKEMAELLGKSIKAVHSYEQGWRVIPADVERQVLFLASRAAVDAKNRKPCWQITKCSPEQRKKCPAWEFNAGDLCWFINGTTCAGRPQGSWDEKIKLCRQCAVLSSLVSDQTTGTKRGIKNG